MSLLAATILTAWATGVLAVGAIVTAVLAYRAFKKQSAEVTAIEKQVKDQEQLTRQQAAQLTVQTGQLQLQQRQFEQQEKDRRQDQASRVFMMRELTTDTRVDQVQRALDRHGHQAVNVYVTNTSQQPVYELRVNWRRGSALWDQPELLPVLAPGDPHQFVRAIPPDLPPGVDLDVFSAAVTFRDRAQVWWRSRPDGRFEELEPGAEPPHSW